MPIAAWIRLRAGGSRRAVAVVALAAGLVAEVAWIREVATTGLDALLRPDAGMTGWGAWALGMAGLVALVTGLTGERERGTPGLGDPDRAFEVALGLFGTGVLLQQLARALG